MPEYVSVAGLAYDWVIAAYFFLGGLSAGAFLFSVGVTYLKPDLRPLGKSSAFAAPVALAAGLLLLLLDLGQPLRAWRLFVSLNPHSALSWGVWFLNVFFVASVLYAWKLHVGGFEKARKFAYLGAPFAVAVGTYTGVLLAQSPGRPLWHSSLLAPMFFNGALISGAALGILLSAGRQETALVAKAGRILAGLILIELGMVAVELLTLFNGGGEGARAAEELLTGGYALPFVGIAVFLGGVAPLLLLKKRGSPVTHAMASALILIGMITLRYVVVVGGQVII